MLCNLRVCVWGRAGVGEELSFFSSNDIVSFRREERLERWNFFSIFLITLFHGAALFFFFNCKFFLTYPMNTHITLFISKLTTLRKTATIYQRGAERLNNALKTTQLKTLELELKVQHLSLIHFTKHQWDLKVCYSTPRYKAFSREERKGW